MNKPAGDLGFQRNERLKSRKTIAQLFKTGSSFVAYPLRIVWLSTQEADIGSASLAVSVPKRNFKTAVERNRIKRQIREAYRLHKGAFYQILDQQQIHVSLMLTFIAKSPESYQAIDSGISKMIRKFPVVLQKN